MRGTLLSFSLVLLAIVCHAQDYKVVANDIGVRSMTRAELKTALKPKNNFWINRNPVLIALPGYQNPVKDVVAMDIYGISFVAMQKYWLSLVFQGRFSAPVNLNTDEETLSFVRKNKGAIGFISGSAQPPPELLIEITN